MLVFFVCFPAKPKPKPKRDAEIEWPEVQAHLPYVDTTTEHVRFKASLGLFTFARCAKRERSKWVEALEPVVGDYGHIKAQTVDREGLPNRQPVHVYYSTAPERIEATGSPTATFAELAILARQAPKGTAQGVLVVDVLVKHVSPPKQVQKQELPKTFRRAPPPTLGPLLGAYLTEFDNNQLSLHDAAVYAHSSFEALRCLHQAGIVHRDVSPWAFVLEVDRPETLLMTHLSLARKIYDTKTKTFVRRRRRVNFFGTMQFGCRAAHAREERSFKDDVESWFYTICHLMWPGQTPWHNLRYDQATEAFEKDALHTEFSKLKEEFLRSFADTENPRNIHAPGPIFASVAEQILKSDYKTQTEEFAPELAKKLEAFAKEVPVASKEKQGKHPLPKLPLRPRCPTDKYLSDDKLPEAVRNGDPDDLYMH
ncbi:hypothetical protein AAVH_14001 [Aphelenchoides avenae]|nr:hypothetical protein AAVH_14001 [Aphelenchus avenae]